MRLLLMRHGIAADVGGNITSDATRPLTEEGKTKMHAAVKGLRRCENTVDIIAASPLLRAQQTAQIVRDEYSITDIETWPELELAEYAPLMQRLYTIDLNATLLCVGHEPGLSRLAAQLLTNSPTGFQIAFKKAGLCALEIGYAFDTPYASLLYFLQPKQLRLMGND